MRFLRRLGAIRRQPQQVPVWAPPAYERPTAPWSQNLDRFAKKVASELTRAAVPHHVDTHHERRPSRPFWIISVDVYQGVYYPYAPWAQDSSLERPQDERVRADFLLLTSEGQLAHQDGLVNPYWWPDLVGSPASDWGSFEHASWAWGNTGFWREGRAHPKRGLRSQWVPRHRGAGNSDPGRGTSAALASFRKTHVTAWPRRFGADTLQIMARHRT